MEAYKDDTNYAVWIAITDIIEKLLTLIDYTEYFEQFKQYGRSLLKPISDKLGWQKKENEGKLSVLHDFHFCYLILFPFAIPDHLDTILRPCVLREMIALEDQASVEQAKNLFASYYNDNQNIPADLRRVVYEGILSEDGKLEVNFEVILQVCTDRLDYQDLQREFSSIKPQIFSSTCTRMCWKKNCGCSGRVG